MSCTSVSAKYLNLSKLTLAAPLVTIQKLSSLVHLKELTFVDNTDKAFSDTTQPTNEMVIRSFGYFANYKPTLEHFDLQVTLHYSSLIVEILEVIVKDLRNLTSFVINIRHDMLAGGEVAPLLAQMTKLRSLTINDAILRPWNLEIVLKKCRKLKMLAYRELKSDATNNYRHLTRYAWNFPKRRIAVIKTRASFTYNQDECTTIEFNRTAVQNRTDQIGNMKIVQLVEV